MEYFNNSIKFACVSAWHSDATTARFIVTFYYNILRNHTGAHFLGHPVVIIVPHLDVRCKYWRCCI